MELTVVVRKEGASYWSKVEQLPGCLASGRTLEELAEALQESIALYLDDREIALSHEPLRVGEASVSAMTR